MGEGIGNDTALSLRLAERGRLCFVPLESSQKLQVGEVVRARLLKRGRVFYARIQERLGCFDGDASFLSALSLQQLCVETVFSPEALTQSASLEVYRFQGEREDMRTLAFVTIDGAQARDFDDAVHASKRSDGGWLVHVAIADVAHYVRTGSALDRDARRRGNSRYLADRVVPMLPPRLSEDLCSLRAGEDRPCVVAEMRLDSAGNLEQSRFARAVLRVRARLTYASVQSMLERREEGNGAGEAEANGEIETEREDEVAERAVLRLHGAWRALRGARRERGALEISRTEHAAHLISDGEQRVRCVGVRASDATDAHRMIEDTMILANVAVAEHLQAASVAFVAREHEPPSFEKWQGLEGDMASLGLRALLGGSREKSRASGGNGARRQRDRLRRILEEVAGRKGWEMFAAHEAVLRAQSQARYVTGGTTKRGGRTERRSEDASPRGDGSHFALGLGCYCHFTSPIRRYADLCVHRSLLRLSGSGSDLSSDSASNLESALASDKESDALCAELVANERSAVMLERVVFQRMVCACLSARTKGEINGEEDDAESGKDEVFEGVVTKVMGFGFFVRLLVWGVEGAVQRSAFANYRYRQMREEAEADGLRVNFGLRVSVRIEDSDAVSGRLTLSLVEALN